MAIGINSSFLESSMYEDKLLDDNLKLRRELAIRAQTKPKVKMAKRELLAQTLERGANELRELKNKSIATHLKELFDELEGLS